MPDKGLEELTQKDRERLADYIPGYDWIPGKFGPPPGVLKARKEELDRMTDRDYMAAVLRMGQEEKESLMVSEAERRRTFKVLWPNPDCVNYKDLAKEGFYYTGILYRGRSDRVQCAFCGGYLGNWEAGDVPKQSHQQFFSYCKMAQRKPCANIPLRDDDENAENDLKMAVVTMRGAVDSSETRLMDLGIISNSPVHPRYRITMNRLDTYKRYSSSYPMKPEELSEAGFFFEGPGDKVRCFWCDGALELWSAGDDAWEEHAKWYPGCYFVQQVQGKDFITKCRGLLTSEDLAVAETLQYNDNGASFLDSDTKILTGDDPVVSAFDTYQVCESLGFTKEELETAYKYNENAEYTNVQVLLNALFLIQNGDHTNLEKILKAEKSYRTDSTDEEADTKLEDLVEEQYLDVEGLLRSNTETLSEERSSEVVSAFTCVQCCKEQVGAVLLPCGHLVLCQKCSFKKIPKNCPVCKSITKGACRTFMG